MRDPDAESSSATVPFSMVGVLDGVATWVTMDSEMVLFMTRMRRQG